MQLKKMKFSDLTGDLQTYFTWSFNALFPFYDGADKYLVANRQAIQKVARKLLEKMDYTPQTIYRGVLLKEPVTQIDPLPNLFFLPFSADRLVAEQFASVKGFGSEIMNLENRLGKYGYVITYTPKVEEILFHYQLFNYLPYDEGFNRLRLNGPIEVAGLKKQKEVSIFQPEQPFTSITAHF